MTSWTLQCTVTGADKDRMNIAGFEALLYSAAQDAANYPKSSGIPVSFMFGWLGRNGEVVEPVSYNGFTLNFTVSTSGLFMTYKLTGFASLAVPMSTPALYIPVVYGIVQPSAIVDGVARASKLTNYYLLDIDHDDAPTLIDHGPLTISFNDYVRGTYSAGKDDYSSWAGCLRYSKSYNASRDAAGVNSRKAKKLSQILNNAVVSPVAEFLKQTWTDTTPQISSYSYWVDEPTMTSPGVIHYKNNAGLLTKHNDDVLQYGTAQSNIISINGSYSGVAYNMTNMNFKKLGFIVDGSGNQVADSGSVINSWSANLGDVYQTANIINDVNALASQFSGDFSVDIPGTTRQYALAQPISLLVMSGNTVSPVTGVYNVVSVTHTISTTFVTNLKIQRLVMSSANQVATQQGIFEAGSSDYITRVRANQTSNIISTGKVDFGTIYPDFTYMYGQV